MHLLLLFLEAVWKAQAAGLCCLSYCCSCTEDLSLESAFINTSYSLHCLVDVFDHVKVFSSEECFYAMHVTLHPILIKRLTLPEETTMLGIIVNCLLDFSCLDYVV